VIYVSAVCFSDKAYERFIEMFSRHKALPVVVALCCFGCTHNASIVQDSVTPVTSSDVAVEQDAPLSTTKSSATIPLKDIQGFTGKVGNTIFFFEGSADLSLKTQSILAEKASWLRLNPRYDLVIEGHATERGTRQYKLALSGRRAHAVRDYIVALGISPRRIITHSYGKERPLEVCRDATCWSRNRRVVLSLRPSPQEPKDDG